MGVEIDFFVTPFEVQEIPEEQQLNKLLHLESMQIQKKKQKQLAYFTIQVILKLILIMRVKQIENQMSFL